MGLRWQEHTEQWPQTACDGNALKFVKADVHHMAKLRDIFIGLLRSTNALKDHTSQHGTSTAVFLKKWKGAFTESNSNICWNLIFRDDGKVLSVMTPDFLVDHDVLQLLKGLLINVYEIFRWTMMRQKNHKGNWKHVQMVDGPQWVSPFATHFNRAGRVLFKKNRMT